MNNDEAQLPDPSELPALDVPNKGVPQNYNVQDSNPNTNPVPNSLPPVQSSQVNTTVTSTGQSATGQAGNSAHSGITASTPSIADDADLIEKEWVEKAKEIVEKTRDNPFLQNKAISEIKVDYIKKRYNKDVSKSEE